jgi:hypothetical protein
MFRTTFCSTGDINQWAIGIAQKLAMAWLQRMLVLMQESVLVGGPEEQKRYVQSYIFSET